MNIAIVCSNYLNMRKDTASGTGIFNYSFINELSKRTDGETLSITAFASGASKLPVPVESIDAEPSSSDEGLVASGKFVLYEQALIAKAFTMQDRFDLYHINIGDGDIALPFAPFVKRPILITLHYTQEAEYIDKYFSLFSNYKNIFFVSISNAQRKFFPDLNYAGTIYHGIETELFKLDQKCGESMMWAGRGVPDKGLETVLEVLKKTKRK